MSGSLYRQMRKLGTEFDQESIVTSQRRRKQPERWSGYVFFFINLITRRKRERETSIFFAAGTRIMDPIDKSRIIMLVIMYR